MAELSVRFIARHESKFLILKQVITIQIPCYELPWQTDRKSIVAYQVNVEI